MSIGRFMLIAVVFASSMTGCVRKPVRAPRAVIPEAGSSELRLLGSHGRAFGDMVALGIGIASGDSHSYLASAEYIFAVDENGNQVAPLSVEEAARQAGGTTALVAGLEGGGGGALLSGLLGSLTGAMIGAAQGGSSGAGKGAAVGAGVGVAVGALGGFYESKSKTEQEIIAQLHGLYFGHREVKKDLPVSGFVFYPKGEYVGVRALLVDSDTNEVRKVTGPVVASP